MLRIANPIPVFSDGQGNLLDNGQIWVGEPYTDPETNPIQVYWDAAGTNTAEQPLRTLGGTVRNGATPSYFYVAEQDYSLKVCDSNDSQITYSASYLLDTQGAQPLDPNLTAISALATTPYGRNLLTLANLAALQAALGGLNYLPSVGGTVTGEILRQGAGRYLYNAQYADFSGRIFYTSVGDPDPTSLPGDIWFEIA